MSAENVYVGMASSWQNSKWTIDVNSAVRNLTYTATLFI